MKATLLGLGMVYGVYKTYTFGSHRSKEYKKIVENAELNVKVLNKELLTVDSCLKVASDEPTIGSPWCSDYRALKWYRRLIAKELSSIENTHSLSNMLANEYEPADSFLKGARAEIWFLSDFDVEIEDILEKCTCVSSNT